jgi:phenylalanyl-tRNA synthetase beta chain
LTSAGCGSETASVCAIEEAVRETSPLLRSIEWSETYQGEGIPNDKKSLTFHLTFGQADRTLETAEVDAAMQAIETALTTKLQAEWRK